mgnify:CR=1 FL=1
MMSPSTRKKLTIGGGGFVGVLVLVLLIAPSFFDLNKYKPQLAAEVKKATGRDLVVDGSVSLRELNRRLGTRFPLDGPRTLNGLILESLQDLPESSVGIRFGPIVVEILNVEDRMVRSARLRLLPDEHPHPPRRRRAGAHHGGSLPRCPGAKS